MNLQTPGPLHLGIERTEIAYASDGQAVFEAILQDWNIENPRITRAQREANARLGAVAYTAFDKAGRELGIDATTLATRLNLAALIRAAYAVAMDADGVGGREPARVDSAKLNALCAPLLPFGEALSRAE